MRVTGKIFKNKELKAKSFTTKDTKVTKDFKDLVPVGNAPHAQVRGVRARVSVMGALGGRAIDHAER